MLTAEENQLLTRVGPGTPAGELLRRYWLPVGILPDVSDEAPTRHVRILGEDMVLFRDKSEFLKRAICQRSRHAKPSESSQKHDWMHYSRKAVSGPMSRVLNLKRLHRYREGDPQMEDEQDGRGGIALRREDTPYKGWQRGEGIPSHTGAHVEDLHTAEVGDWPRVGQKGALINLAAQEEDDGWLIELAPGGQTEMLQHLFEATIYVVEGRGATTIWQAGSNQKQTVEWSTGSLFSPPLNCCYQHFNLDGGRPARLFAGTTAPLMINATREPEFIFNCPYVFSNRYNGADDYFTRPAQRLPNRLWQTNFVPDIHTFNLDVDQSERRGRGNASNRFTMSANGMTVLVAQYPPGTYKKGHRHGSGAYLIILEGTGYSRFWFKDEEPTRVDWKRGSIFSPREGEYHQHFNTGPTPARYLACLYTWTFSIQNTITPGGPIVSEREGGWQIEYEDEDPEVYALFERECAKHGSKVILPRPQYSWA